MNRKNHLFKRQKQFLSQVIDNLGNTTGIIGARNLSGKQAMRIYHEAYFARLQDALLEKYDSVWAVLGDKKFHNICQRYIKQNKPTDYNLENYGGEFSNFLKKEKVIEKDFPFLVGLAEFENLMDQVFHAPTEKLRKYNEKTFPELKDTSYFKLVSYLKLPVFQYNICDIWKATQEDEQIEILPTTQYLLISKNKNAVFVREIDKFTSYFLKSCLKGQNISEVMNSYKNIGFDDLLLSLEEILESYVLVKVV